jgi:hypothetical protein
MNVEQEGKPMRSMLLALAATLLLGTATAAQAQVDVHIGFPGVHIGLDVPTYPHLVRVPGYPVYYDSRGDSNYFFYDGLYWVYWDDNWYSSSWYNGPWHLTGPEYVPFYLLRVPVRYYRRPPSYFHGWRANAPPRWGDHWGHTWESQRSGWNRWNHASAPAPAPLPVYQRQYSGDRYPRTAEQESSIRTQNYRYKPREAVSQQHLAPAPAPVTREVRPAPQVHEQKAQPQQQVRESRPAPQVHESRPAPQARENRPAPQAQENRPAPQVHEQKAQPQPQVRESRPAPQAHENRPAPQAREKAAAPGKGQENKNKEHGREKSDR